MQDQIPTEGEVENNMDTVVTQGVQEVVTEFSWAPFKLKEP